MAKLRRVDWQDTLHGFVCKIYTNFRFEQLILTEHLEFLWRIKEYIIKVNPEEVNFKYMDWIYMSQDTQEWAHDNV